MEDTFDKYAVAVIIVFGAMITGGLMAATIAFGDRLGFVLTLGAAAGGLLAGYAMLIDRPRVYAAFEGISVLLAIASTLTLIK